MRGLFSFRSRGAARGRLTGNKGRVVSDRSVVFYFFFLLTLSGQKSRYEKELFLNNAGLSETGDTRGTCLLMKPPFLRRSIFWIFGKIFSFCED